MQTAHEVARAAGLHLRQNGSRFWTCCPIHGEKEASMCFFPDGRFHCFGCGAHGDAADLYAALHGVSLAEALRTVKGESYAAKPRTPTAADLRRTLDEWRGRKWAEACRELHAAQAIMTQMEQRYTPEELMQNELFGEAAERKATANDILNLLDSASMAQLLKWRTNEQIQ